MATAAPRSRSCCRQQKVVVKGALEENQHLVAALRDALLERDELIGKEITDVLDQARDAGPPPAVIDLRAAEAAMSVKVD